jgi:hydroxymethylbilane synthase
MLPQVGQGAIAVECRDGDEPVLELVRAIDEPAVRAAVESERSFLAELGGGCDLPVAAYARVDGDSVTVEGMLASPDGRMLVRDRRSGPAGSGPSLGAELASALVQAQGAME